MDTIFDRTPFTDWIIVVRDRYFDKLQEVQYAESGIYDFDEFTGTYRTTMRGGKECESFTLMARNMDYAYLWVNIFKNGDVEYVSHIPSVINTDKKKKRIDILPLVHCNYNKTKQSFEFSYIEEYKSNFKIVYK